MWEFDTEFSEIIQRTPQVKSFRLLVRSDAATYQPGQFFFITIKIQDQEAAHHFSFSSSPTEQGYIEFTKRITPHEFSQALDAIKPGYWAHLGGPFGSFTLPKEEQKLAFLSGGIGITPLRSMLRYVTDTGQSWHIVLLYGNASFEDIVFSEELDAMAKAGSGLRVVHVLSNPPSGWTGKTGLINKDLVAEVIPDCMTRTHYISGPPKMVASLEEQLLALNVPRAQLKKDSFTGYD